MHDTERHRWVAGLRPVCAGCLADTQRAPAAPAAPNLQSPAPPWPRLRGHSRPPPLSARVRALTSHARAGAPRPLLCLL
ncbi:unnamed protein product [Rangifer tarandus platyrhynchus]|uniref:Uncharacterized protein n=1 Tax=Rangifer tarandus platyrhynchus TaxID=3082113 RepID=A0AC59YLE5_RANTA